MIKQLMMKTFRFQKSDTKREIYESQEELNYPQEY